MNKQGTWTVILAAAGLLAAMPAAAQRSACVLDSTDKVCAEIVAQPSATVQASRLDGVRDTFVNYKVTLTGVTRPTSSRWVNATFTLSPAVPITQLSSRNNSCTYSGSTVSCAYDKLTSLPTETLEFTAKAPQFQGSSTPSTLTNTGVFGWQGRTANVSHTLGVSTAGGYSYVPPNTTVALVTAPENPDPSTQASAQNPFWGKMVIPGRPVGFLAYFALDVATDEDFSQSCSGGLFHSGNSDGGPYVCRDIGFPYDAGVGARWVVAAVDEEVNDTFVDNPVEFTLIWDDSIVSPEQLSPSPSATNGTPTLAVFYHAQEAEGAPQTHPIRAFGKDCTLNLPPCVTGVQEYSTGDWTAKLRLSQVYNYGAEADPLPVILGRLDRLLDSIVNPARAGILPGGIMK